MDNISHLVLDKVNYEVNLVWKIPLIMLACAPQNWLPSEQGKHFFFTVWHKRPKAVKNPVTER